MEALIKMFADLITSIVAFFHDIQAYVNNDETYANDEGSKYLASLKATEAEEETTKV